MSVRFKPEVRLTYIDYRLADVLQAAAIWSALARVDIEVNSMNDGPGVHLATSLHYYNLAIDLDTVGDRPADLALLAEFMRRWLNPSYDVVYEDTHLHVEWDAHRPALPRVTT